MSVVTWPSTIRITLRTKLREESGVAVDQTDDGEVRLRALYPQAQYEMRFAHAALSSAERATVETFLSDNALNQIDIAVAGATYRVRKTGPYEVDWLGGGLSTITWQGRGVKL